MHHRIFGPQQMGVTHRAPHDAAQDIPTTLVRRHYPVGHHKRCGPQVIGNHPVMYIMIPVRIDTRSLRRGLNQRLEKIGMIIVMAALQQRANALQAHASID